MGNKKARGMLLAMMDMPEAGEAEFIEWSDKHHVPARLACPGFLGYRRFVAVKGSPKFMVMYEVEGPEALESPEYKGLSAKLSPAEQAQSRRIHDSWTNFVRNIYVEVETPHTETSIKAVGTARR
jgi:hypothetical protein